MTKQTSITTNYSDKPTTQNTALLTPHLWHMIGIIAAASMVGLISAQFLSVQMAGAAALTVFCIGLWATAVVPEYWPALAFFLIAMIFEIAPAQTVFSGFYSSTFWLLFSGIVLGAAITHTGLSQRAAALLSRMLGTHYSSMIAGIVGFSLALAFVMPSAMGRIVLLVPIMLALADHMGYSADSKGRKGMLIAATFGTFFPAFAILPSNAPNMMLAGMVEHLYGYQLAYWDYLRLHFPILGAAKAVFLVLLILWLFPDHDPKPKKSTQNIQENITPMRPAERHLVTVLSLCLILWLMDGIHKISPGWIGLAAALYCLWPPSNLTSKKCLSQDINYGPLFFVAGIMGLGAVISVTGLGETVVQSLSQQADFAADQPLWNVLVLTTMSTLMAIVINLPGIPAVMTPIAENLSNITGLSLTTVLMTQVLAFSNVLMPYQAPPLVAAMQLTQLPVRIIIKLCLALFAISIFILLPFNLLWWQWLGLF